MDSSLGSSPTRHSGKPEAISEQLALLRAHFERPVSASAGDPAVETLAKYRITRCLTSRDMRYACIGVSLDCSGWCLLGDHPLLDKLLSAAQLGTERERLRYFRCLLQSYWSFTKNAANISEDCLDGWVALREWLVTQTTLLAATNGAKPRWFDTLRDHANLLAAEPFATYGKELRPDFNTTVNELLDRLSVPANSWLREEAAYVRIRTALEQGDADFCVSIGRLVEIALGEGLIRLPEAVSRRCLALLVSRYATCSSHPEVTCLRDTALRLIGHPWQKRSSWDEYVVDTGGRPDQSAREMVEGWLKLRLIKDFFALLSEDQDIDGRRLKYWLRFEPLVDEMWFALGPRAMRDNGSHHAAFRRQASGRLLELSGCTPEDNALIMRVGQYLLVESGLNKNPCLVYSCPQLSQGLSIAIDCSARVSHLNLDNLKQKAQESSIFHVGAWESDFDAKILVLSGAPSKKPSLLSSKDTSTLPRNKFEKFVAQHALEVDGATKPDGLLWVRSDDSDPQISTSLQAWGFAYRHGKGWWRKHPWQDAFSHQVHTARLRP